MDKYSNSIYSGKFFFVINFKNILPGNFFPWDFFKYFYEISGLVKMSNKLLKKFRGTKFLLWFFIKKKFPREFIRKSFTNYWRISNGISSSSKIRFTEIFYQAVLFYCYFFTFSLRFFSFSVMFYNLTVFHNLTMSYNLTMFYTLIFFFQLNFAN